MYPVIRLGLHALSTRSAPPMRIGDTHVSHHRVWPHDLDVWMELNNGRGLTLLDIGRFGMFMRLGLVGLMRERRWAGAVAGASTRYRHRLRAFDRVEMRTAMVGWDARFAYAEQSLWLADGRCALHALQRLAVSGKGGLVPAPVLAEALGYESSPPLPDWIRAWAEADARRPWPPEGAPV